MQEGVLPIVADPVYHRRHARVGFGLWMDIDWRRSGWDVADPRKNWFTPEAFAQSASHALASADTYVWIYTETPRWWSAEGRPQKLPPAYDLALRAARDRVPAQLAR